LSNRTALAAILLAAAACSDSATEPPTDIDLMRQASEKYGTAAAAMADGFVPLSDCVAGPAGGMGFHYGHPARMQDAVIDPSLPEILLFEPTAGGGTRLVGVEFLVHEGAWYGAGNTSAPSVAGRTFDPPNPEHPDENLREMYTLHAWIWQENPAGMFAPFNSTVSCGP
jgi:hypothetical protein